jgi:hypothetical protein
MRDGSAHSQKWRLIPHDGCVDLVQENPIRTLHYQFMNRDKHFELNTITVKQYNQPVPPIQIVFYPPLPDMRCRFDGSVTSHFVIDNNGQASFAYGTVQSKWEESGPGLRVNPERPWWVADRTMQTLITFDKSGSAGINILRID